jgi:hypothetical protein
VQDFDLIKYVIHKSYQTTKFIYLLLHFQNSIVNQTLLLDNYNKEKSVVYLEEQMGLPETLARYSYRQQGPCSKTWQQGMQLQQQFDGV